jgi:hypothetical protein
MSAASENLDVNAQGIELWKIRKLIKTMESYKGYFTYSRSNTDFIT